METAEPSSSNSAPVARAAARKPSGRAHAASTVQKKQRRGARCVRQEGERARGREGVAGVAGVAGPPFPPQPGSNGQSLDARIERGSVDQSRHKLHKLRAATAAPANIQCKMFKFMNTRLLINMSATTDTLKSPLRQAMQRMTNQSYQEYWEGLIADAAQGDAATLVRENVDHKRIVFFFPAILGRP